MGEVCQVNQQDIQRAKAESVIFPSPAAPTSLPCRGIIHRGKASGLRAHLMLPWPCENAARLHCAIRLQVGAEARCTAPGYKPTPSRGRNAACYVSTNPSGRRLGGEAHGRASLQRHSVAGRSQGTPQGGVPIAPPRLCREAYPFLCAETPCAAPLQGIAAKKTAGMQKTCCGNV